MDPTFTIKHKHFSKHHQGFALQLSDSINSCLERGPTKYRNGQKRTGTDQNGPNLTQERTKIDMNIPNLRQKLMKTE